MHPPPKIRYEIDLREVPSAPPMPLGAARTITPGDTDGLAALMLDAYIGTIDYDGETLTDAVQEVRSYFEDAPLTDNSFLVLEDGKAVAGVLLSMVNDLPFVGYVMTGKHWKGRGLGTAVTNKALSSLLDAGHERAALYITEGNEASEALFRKLGARAIPDG